MHFLLRLMSNQNRMLDEKKDGDGGGAGGGEGDKNKPDHTKEIADLKSQIDELKSLLTKKADDKKDQDDPLSRKADDIEKDKLKKAAEGKDLENSIKFNLKSGEFFKNNESLLPKDFKALLEASEKENYGSEVEKARAIKASMVKKFFEQQANMDLLTQGQKTVLEDFLKMTNTARQEKASEVYDMIFEPALEKLKAIRKADALNKGHGSPSDQNEAYKNKLIAHGKQRFLGEKQNA